METLRPFSITASPIPLLLREDVHIARNAVAPFQSRLEPEPKPETQTEIKPKPKVAPKEKS
jgi:hypothetical protein